MRPAAAIYTYYQASPTCCLGTTSERHFYKERPVFGLEANNCASLPPINQTNRTKVWSPPPLHSALLHKSTQAPKASYFTAVQTRHFRNGKIDAHPITVVIINLCISERRKEPIFPTERERLSAVNSLSSAFVPL